MAVDRTRSTSVVKSWPSRNTPARIDPESMGSKTSALTIRTCLVLDLGYSKVVQLKVDLVVRVYVWV